MNIQQKISLVTISSRNFIPGTIAMIKSFLKNNAWFEGSIYVITENKKELIGLKKILNRKVIVCEPGNILKQTVEQQANKFPLLKKLKHQLYIVELFNMMDYSHLIYCDSDMLHLAPIKPEEVLQSNISAVRDPWYFRGYYRDRITLKRIPKNNKTDSVYTNFINSGFITLPVREENKIIYHQLIKMIQEMDFSVLDDFLSDESILNSFFCNKVNMLPLQYNTPVHMLFENIETNNPVIVHFTGKNKPWILKSWFVLNFRTVRYSRYLTKWLLCYISI